MNQPKQLTILGRRVKLQFTDLEDGDFGQFTELPHTIKIQSGLAAETVQSVLIHEMVHAALAIAGIANYSISNEAEESICTVMETAVPDIMKALRRMKVDEFDSDLD